MKPLKPGNNPESAQDELVEKVCSYFGRIYDDDEHRRHMGLRGHCYDHGRFVYHNLIEGLPFIKDDSTEADIHNFETIIKDFNIDFIYPAMDGVIPPSCCPEPLHPWT